MIPYGRQTIEEDDIEEVVKVLKSDFLTTGPKVAEFERAVAEYVGAKYAVAISNDTAALHAACHAAGIGPGDEVITTPVTFAASANCVLYCGGTPVFADIDPHVIAKEHHLIVIEDAAHALGSEYKGRRIGSMSDMTTFSFHPVKPITTGEGGMIVTDSEELYRKLVLFRSHGITRDPELMTRNEGPWFYQQLDLGYNYRMTDIQCALGCSQMRKLDRFLARRREITKRYDEAFADCANIVTPYQLPETNSGWHLYIIQVKNHDRKTVFEQLRENGIAVNVHYIPVYYHPYYQEHGYKEVHCPVAEEVYAHIISLPVYPGLTDEQQDTVIETVKRLTK